MRKKMSEKERAAFAEKMRRARAAAKKKRGGSFKPGEVVKSSGRSKRPFIVNPNEALQARVKAAIERAKREGRLLSADDVFGTGGDKTKIRRKVAARTGRRSNPAYRVHTVGRDGSESMYTASGFAKAQEMQRRFQAEGATVRLVPVPPKTKRPAAKRTRKRNGDGGTAAKAMFERFHQKPSKGHRDFMVPTSRPTHLAKLGKLVELHVNAPNGHYVLRPKGVTLACTGDGSQMYFLGGDQVPPLRAMGVAESKDHAKLGPLTKIIYFTEKGFHNFEPIEYVHRMGEDGGTKPDLVYDTKSKLIYLVGGTYLVKKAGIVN